jgi:hypothetical protein
MRITLALLALLLAPAGAWAQGARLQLDSLDRLAKQAAEVVTVTIDEDMLRSASSLVKDKGNAAQAKAIMSELKGIYVRVFEFNGPVVTQAELEPIRKQLAQGGWSPIINIDSRDDNESVQIYMWRENNVPAGMAILVAEPDELTVVNIVGPIDFAKLAALGGQFGIPNSIPGVR